MIGLCAACHASSLSKTMFHHVNYTIYSFLIRYTHSTVHNCVKTQDYTYYYHKVEL